ncbi:LytR/AlgR family response regulator transcription factor [Flavobacterium sp.]|uniref:LytR/AlgR family response regulator transcription factor n=1 Tax=Flavobacterium sp. TaxID=239 RepID=UPI003B993EBB
MSKLRCYIVDDERSGRELLGKLLVSVSDAVEIVGTAADIEQAFNELSETEIDLLFLDIQMPKGNGFSLLKKFENQLPFDVIFVTSYQEYAIQAIKSSALDYLLKPVDRQELSEALLRAQNLIQSRETSRQQFENLFKNLENESSSKKIAIHHNDTVVFIPENEMEFIAAAGRYCSINTSSGATYTTARSLKEMEEMLSKNYFMRISHSQLVNCLYIKSYSKGDPCFLELNSGKTFEISRRRKHEILQKLKSQ